MDTAAIESQLAERSTAERVRHVLTTCGTSETIASTVAMVPMAAIRSASRIGKRQPTVDGRRAKLRKRRAAGGDVEWAIAVVRHGPAARTALDRHLATRELHHFFGHSAERVHF